MIALLDGDIVAYQAAMVAVQTIDWEDGEGPSASSDLPIAVQTACKTADEWTRLAGCRQPIVCFSSRHGSNFRKVIDPVHYKYARGDKPDLYWQVVAALEDRYKFSRIEGLEADDIMGILGTSEKLSKTVVVSLDKDMRGIPATVLNPSKDSRPQRISSALADYWWMTQTLTGDACDGYKGCPKIGPVNAARILGDCNMQLGAMWPAVVAAYAAKGLTEADALLQARLARILRRSDYDREKGTIQLWHLTKPETLALSHVCATPSPAPSVAPPSPPKPALRSTPKPRRNRPAA